MKKSVYTTLAAKPMAAALKKITDYYQEMSILDKSRFLPVGNPKSDILKIAPGTENVMQWDLPLEYGGKVLIDTRMFEKANGQISKAYELKYLYNRCMLEHLWLTSDVHYEAIIDPLVAYYSEWLRQLITSRFAINPLQQTYYQVFFAFYYWQKLLPEDTKRQLASEDYFVIFNRFAKRSLKITPNIVDDICGAPGFTKLTEMIDAANADLTLNAVCEAANEFVDSPAIKVDTATLVSFAFVNSWFGHTANMITATAIEHPPMFAHMVYLAATNSTYNNTNIGRAVAGMSRKVIRPDNMVKWMNQLTEDYGLNN